MKFGAALLACGAVATSGDQAKDFVVDLAHDLLTVPIDLVRVVRDAISDVGSHIGNAALDCTTPERKPACAAVGMFKTFALDNEGLRIEFGKFLSEEGALGAIARTVAKGEGAIADLATGGVLRIFKGDFIGDAPVRRAVDSVNAATVPFFGVPLDAVRRVEANVKETRERVAAAVEDSPLAPVVAVAVQPFDYIETQLRLRLAAAGSPEDAALVDAFESVMRRVIESIAAVPIAAADAAASQAKAVATDARDVAKGVGSDLKAGTIGKIATHFGLEGASAHHGRRADESGEVPKHSRLRGQAYQHSESDGQAPECVTQLTLPHVNVTIPELRFPIFDAEGFLKIIEHFNISDILQIADPHGYTDAITSYVSVLFSEDGIMGGDLAALLAPHFKAFSTTPFPTDRHFDSDIVEIGEALVRGVVNSGIGAITGTINTGINSVAGIASGVATGVAKIANKVDF